MSLTIIGFGKVTVRDLGKTGLEQQCVWCSSHVFYHLIFIRTWFTYFFIPLIPYRSEYRVECPACLNGIRITGRELEAARQGELTLRRGQTG
jgi:hypothetical protein